MACPGFSPICAATLDGEERLPGRLDHLQRAQDAQAVARPEAQRRRRIAPRELGVERLAVAALGRGTDALAHRLGHGRDVGEALDEGLEVKARAADQDRQAARGARLRQHRCGVAQIVSDGEVHRAVDMAVEPVRRLRLLLWGRSRGEDAQVAVDLHRIRVDDQAAEPRREVEGERRLARGGRACNEDGPSPVEHRNAVVLVATLISNPRAPAITDAVLREAGRALATDHRPHRLHGEIAADLLFDDDGGRRVAALRAALAGAPIDIVAQPAGQRRKRLFLADMDSTMIEQECIDELADTIGLKAEVAAISPRMARSVIAATSALRPT